MEISPGSSIESDGVGKGGRKLKSRCYAHSSVSLRYELIDIMLSIERVRRRRRRKRLNILFT